MVLILLATFLLLPIGGLVAQDAGKAVKAFGNAKKDLGKAKKDLGKAKKDLGKAKKDVKLLDQVRKDTAKAKTATATEPSAAKLGKRERSIHGLELEKYLTIRKPGMNTDEVWERVSRTLIHPATYRNEQLKGIQEVYGFHPFWMGTAWKSYNFELVNHVGYYAYPVQAATGESRGDMNQWQTTGMVEEAHLHGAKVDLVAALYGEADTRKFLDNKTAQARLIANLIDALFARGDGVNIDFPDVPQSHKAQFSAFVIYLHERLKLADPGYELRVTLPILDEEEVFEFDKIANVVSAFVVTGYDCYGALNGKAGPASVLKSEGQWLKPDLDMSITHYLAAGLPADKFVLCLPNFGKEWRVTTNDKGHNIASIDAIRPYNFFLQPQMDGKTLFDKESGTSYRIGKGAFVTRFYWWDDLQSHRLKFDLAKQKGLRGIGMWALGYDNGCDELWNLLHTDYAEERKDTTKPTKPVVKPKQSWPFDHISRSTVGDFRWIRRDTIALPRAFLTAPGEGREDFLLMYGYFNIAISRDLGLLLSWLLLILVVFLELGFLLALMRSDVREIVFVHRKYLAYALMLALTCIPLLVLWFLGYHISFTWTLIIIMAGQLFASLLSARMVQIYYRPKP